MDGDPLSCAPGAAGLAAGGEEGVRIERIEAIGVRLPMHRPMKMAGVLIESADNLLVRVAGDDGRVGWGEAASAPTMTGELVAGMRAAVEHLTPSLLGRPAAGFLADPAALDRQLHGNAAAKAALDMALHDLVARSLGVPVHALLGGRRRDRVPVLWLLGTGSAEGDLAEARARLAEGFVAFKIKVGVGDPVADAERTRRIVEGLPADVLVSADANQGWDVAQAAAFLAALGDARLDFLEQPVASGDADALERMGRLAGRTGIPFGCDEGIHHLDDVRRHRQAGAAAGCSLKAIKLGGLGRVLEAALECERLGMAVNLACKVAESGISTAAVLQLAAVLPSVAWGVSLSSQYLAHDIVRGPPAVRAGHADVPEGPGLGIDVDEIAVDRFRA